MARHQYLITYDISDDKRRTSVFKTLTGQGNHVQYSVFLCALNRMELVSLKTRLAEAINAREDQVIVVDMGKEAPTQEMLLDCIGKRYNPPVRVQIV